MRTKWGEKLFTVALTVALALPIGAAWADDTQVDTSTVEAAQAAVTADAFKNAGASADDAAKLKTQADSLLATYVTDRLEALRSKYLNAAGGWTDENINKLKAAASAIELDEIVAGMYPVESDPRTKRVAALIDAATSIDAVWAINVMANLDARKWNSKEAAKLIEGLPDSPEKAAVQADIDLLNKFVAEYEPRLAGVPYWDKIPADFKAANDDEKKAIYDAKDQNAKLNRITDHVIEKAAKARKSVTVVGSPEVYKNEAVAAFGKAFLAEGHPYYVGDAVRAILPALDVYAQLLSAQHKAHEDITAALEMAVNKVNESTEATDEEKQAAIEEIKKASQKADEAIDGMTSADEADAVVEAGKQEIFGVMLKAVKKPESKQKVDEAIAKARETVENRTDLSVDEKAELLKRIDEVSHAVMGAIDAATANQKVDDSVESAVMELDQIVKTQAKAKEPKRTVKSKASAALASTGYSSVAAIAAALLLCAAGGVTAARRR
ncbi:DUF1542 domain-containing protein [Schaalia sp. lx-260]|uniref:DUF1542 domain-containing protein n=1 Tax=Schaalia sp. lx-260 TaxID=2899082 RepID=UPI001E29F50B|nr:DUF1542 domain-containing protein [Schaalia sp. lx-260]MCD4550080.1 DUF1542 domain-containing protein [Schaalia sp. lx-260]